MTPRFHMGVDGGGTHTRLRLCSAEGQHLGGGRAGPSALGQGATQAWRHIGEAAAQAVAEAVAGGQLPAGTCFDRAFMAQTRLGLGLSGAENPAWVEEFARLSPPWAEQRLVSDGLTAVLGAHAGHIGAVVTLGTGGIGVALHADEQVVVTGGWGWQLGDEGSGAWLGRQAVACAQHAMDGREPEGTLAQAVAARCGADRSALLDWCAQAGQGDFAALAPLVFAHEACDPLAARLVDQAVSSVLELVRALDAEGVLPLVIGGSIGERLTPRLPLDVLARQVMAQGDACDGALRLLQRPWAFLNNCAALGLAA